ncbi:MAG TPA: outer membrane protein assembly factor BamD [Thermoanaerobaculia bacterium]|nr:outer membrane protein assembly factor BamD [Thermoanaerobaculia bacterium]
MTARREATGNGGVGRRVPAGSWLVLACLALGGLAACKGGPAVDPILQLSAQEALARGKELMADEKYARARDYLNHAFEVSPNSLEGREALLLVADCFHLDGGRANFIQAEAKYRDYLNRFPTSDRGPYVQFQIANSLAQRMGRPDRDLTATHEALEAYEDLLRLYPTSEYAAQAREKIRVVEENLAEHEYVVGDFYLRYRLPRAAVQRFEYLLENYPGYSEKEKVLFKLGVAQAQGRLPAEARETYERLAREFPESPYLSRLPEIPDADEAGGEADGLEAAETSQEGSR